jgi:hypothetical protein
VSPGQLHGLASGDVVDLFAQDVHVAEVAGDLGGHVSQGVDQ